MVWQAVFLDINSPRSITYNPIWGDNLAWGESFLTWDEICFILKLFNFNGWIWKLDNPTWTVGKIENYFGKQIWMWLSFILLSFGKMYTTFDAVILYVSLDLGQLFKQLWLWILCVICVVINQASCWLHDIIYLSQTPRLLIMPGNCILYQYASGILGWLNIPWNNFGKDGVIEDNGRVTPFLL